MVTDDSLPAMLRRYLAEFLGTFALVFFGCGTRDMVGDTTNFAGIFVVHAAFAFTVALMIYSVGYLSSAHFNPAISVGLAITRRFPWRFVLPYWLAQFAGAILAVTIHFIVMPDKASAAHFGATIPKISVLPAILIEIILTFFLMFATMAAATDKRFKRADSGLTIAFTILVCGLMANSLSGASMNPARSLAPALFAGGDALSSLWIFFVGPLIGAILGGLVYEATRGSQQYAKGALEDLPVTIETKGAKEEEQKP
ncbi:MAG TPA: MIP/aquaporin family protein [Ktedonobacteraceae bacterium]|nr:MIP/aquaporin family protein [Ktedonobacteraceae bacterium]